MSIQKVFDIIDLREYIFSYLFSFNKIIQLDKVHIFELHKNKPAFINLINEYSIDIASEYNSIKIIKWIHYNINIQCTEYAMDIAAYNGNLEILSFLHKNRSEGCSYNSFIYASENNKINVIRWLNENYEDIITRYSYRYAIKNSIINENIELLKYLYDNYKKIYNDSLCFFTTSISLAIKTENLEIIHWLHNRSKYYSYCEFFNAAKTSNKLLLEWMYENRDINDKNFTNTKEFITNNIYNREYSNYYVYSKNHPLIFASEKGNLEIVKLIYEKDNKNITISIIQKSVKFAAINGYLDVIIFLQNIYNNIKIYTNNIISYVASTGQLEIIKYIHNNNNNNYKNNISGKMAIDLACLNGHFDVIKWLDTNRDDGCSKNALYNACKNGHLEIVKWLIDNKKLIFINKRGIDFAAYNGHLDIIKYLYKKNLTCCTTKAMDNAAKNGHLNCLKFLHKYLNSGFTSNAIDNASNNGHIDVVKWLYKSSNECFARNAMDLSAKNGHINIVIWLHNNRNEGCSKDAMDLASKNGYINIVKFLHNNRKEGCSTDAIDFAAENGHLLIIKYLLLMRSEGFTNRAILNSYAKGYTTVSNYLFENKKFQV